MKNKITIFLDAIFSFILFTVVFFALLKRLTNSPYSLLGAITLSLITQNAYLSNSIKNRAKNKNKEKMKNFFIFTPTNHLEYFASALSTRYKVKVENGKLTVGNTFVYLCLSHSPLSYSQVVDAFKNRTSEKIVILCFTYDKKARYLASTLSADVKIMDENKVFRLLCLLDALPKCEVQTTKKYPLKEILHDFSNAKISKRLFFSSLVIALFSFITPFKNYYAIISFFLLLLFITPFILKLILQTKEQR